MCEAIYRFMLTCHQHSISQETESVKVCNKVKEIERQAEIKEVMMFTIINHCSEKGLTKEK